jgi:hypothetical protein
MSNFNTITFNPASNVVREENDKAFFTIEALVDELFLCLAKTQQTITNEENVGKEVTVRKYYRQARDLMKWIPIAKPAPVFIIHMSDLTAQVKNEFNGYDISLFVLQIPIRTIIVFLRNLFTVSCIVEIC